LAERHSLSPEAPRANAACPLAARLHKVAPTGAHRIGKIHIYKAWGGQIHAIEAMGIVLPYMSPTGWEK